MKNGQPKLDDIAAQIVEWHDREWLNPDDDTKKSIEQVFNKLVEEVGEMVGANTKLREQRVDKNWLSELIKEFGDAMVVMCVIADRIQQLEDNDTGPNVRSARVTPMNMLLWRWENVQHRRSDRVRTEGNVE